MRFKSNVNGLRVRKQPQVGGVAIGLLHMGDTFEVEGDPVLEGGRVWRFAPSYAGFICVQYGTEVPYAVEVKDDPQAEVKEALLSAQKKLFDANAELARAISLIK